MHVQVLKGCAEFEMCGFLACQADALTVALQAIVILAIARQLRITGARSRGLGRHEEIENVNGEVAQF